MAAWGGAGGGGGGDEDGFGVVDDEFEEDGDDVEVGVGAGVGEGKEEKKAPGFDAVLASVGPGVPYTAAARRNHDCPVCFAEFVPAAPVFVSPTCTHCMHLACRARQLLAATDDAAAAAAAGRPAPPVRWPLCRINT